MHKIVFPVALALSAATVSAGEAYHLTEQIPAESKYWDYSSIDSNRGVFYLGRSGGVLALNLKTKQLNERLFPGGVIHAVTPVTSHLIVASDGPKNVLIVFDADARAIRTTVKVGWHPDAVAFDQGTNTVATINKGSQDLSLVDTTNWQVRASVKLPGNPEFAVSDGHGLLYVNIADQDRIAIVDLRSKQLIGGNKLQGCHGPTGIGYDKELSMVISVCENGVAKFMSAPSLIEVASLAVGRGADAVLLDEGRGLVFIPAGDDGTLSVISVHSVQDIRLLQTLKTEVSAGSGAVDLVSGKVYLPAGRQIRVPAPPGQWQPAKVAKDSFHILVISPISSSTN
jgi:hypothetical protein